VGAIEFPSTRTVECLAMSVILKSFLEDAHPWALEYAGSHEKLSYT
jgi:hypothetical protein